MKSSGRTHVVAAGVVSVGFLLHTSTLYAATIQVRAGQNLQTAIDAAQPGDTLVLDPGATYSGNFVLPVKSGAGFITIRTADSPDLPSANTRVFPSHAPRLAKIQSPNAGPAITTAAGSHHWRLLLLEFPSTHMGYGEILQIGDGSESQNTLDRVPHDIELDRLYIHGHPDLGQKRGVALNAASVTIRHCYISDIKAIGMDTQAIGGWNGPGPYVIENNYLEASGENVMFGGADPWIPNLVTTGVVFRFNHVARPVAWRNPIVPAPSGLTATQTSGYLGAGAYSYQVIARRPVGSGATATSSASTTVTGQLSGIGGVLVRWNAVPGATEYLVYGRTAGAMDQYWTVTGTSFTDIGINAGTPGTPPGSLGDRWLVKNLFELKNARDVTVEYNIFENNWAHGQSGWAIVFTPRNQDGSCPWCIVANVTFQYNIVRNVASGVNILGFDDLAPSRQTTDITVRHNLFYEMRQSLGGSGWFVMMGAGPANVRIDHNTIDSESNAVLYVTGGTEYAPEAVVPFQFTNNAARHSDYGINGSHFAFGLGIIGQYFPGGVVSGNWLQGGPATSYPSGNYFSGTFSEAFVNTANGNFQPAAGSILIGHATDGTDIGADIATLTRITGSVIEGRLGPKPPTNLRVK